MTSRFPAPTCKLNGEDQPEGNMTTDSKGRFHFQVCEGQVQPLRQFPPRRRFRASQRRSGRHQRRADFEIAGEDRHVRRARAPLKGSPLPDLAGVNLAGDAAPASQPVLLCLFDAGQRSSRHVVRQLDEQAAALRQQGVTVLGVQAAVTTDEILNEWKSASPVSFPLGRVTEKSEKIKMGLRPSRLAVADPHRRRPSRHRGRLPVGRVGRADQEIGEVR